MSKDIVSKLMKLQKAKCVCCRTSLTKENRNLDHIEPLSKGGAHTDFNVQLLCQKCNFQKHTKDPIDFMQSRGFLL